MCACLTLLVGCCFFPSTFSLRQLTSNNLSLIVVVVAAAVLLLRHTAFHSLLLLKLQLALLFSVFLSSLLATHRWVSFISNQFPSWTQQRKNNQAFLSFFHWDWRCRTTNIAWWLCLTWLNLICVFYFRRRYVCLKLSTGCVFFTGIFFQLLNWTFFWQIWIFQ